MKKLWNEYVRELMAKNGKNQNDIAEALDKTQGAIGHWMTGRRSANFEDVAKILNVVGAEKVILNKDGTIEDFDKNAEIVQITKSFHYPLLSPIQAGMFTEINLLSEIDNPEQFEMIASQINAGENAFFLRIQGQSMLPRFNEGDLVLIDPSLEIRPGDFVCAVNGNHEATFKQYKQLGSIDEYGRPAFELVPLNDFYPRLSSLEHQITLIGKAVEHRVQL